MTKRLIVIMCCSTSVAEGVPASGSYFLEQTRSLDVHGPNGDLQSCGQKAIRYISSNKAFVVVYAASITVNGVPWEESQSAYSTHATARKDDLIPGYRVQITFGKRRDVVEGALSIYQFDDHGIPRCGNSVALKGTFRP